MSKIDEIYNKSGFKMDFGLDRIAALLDHAGNPQNGINFIHITGTNGKGSVSRMIYEILNMHGLVTGLYTSPHLVRFNERIVVNNTYISDEDLERLTVYFMEALSSGRDLAKMGKLTFFELTTAICFKYFEEKKADIAVIEAGLGGSLDATNVIKRPLISVITNISMDHSAILGHSLKKIAADKAGIIKRNSVIITGESKKKIKELIFNYAVRMDSKAYSTDMIRLTKKGGLYCYDGLYNSIDGITLSNKALYQKYNLKTALLSVEVLFELYKDLICKTLEKDLVRKGLNSFKHEGRFEIIRLKGRTVILDGAHNPDGIEKLAGSLKAYFKNSKWTIVFAVMQDKDYKTMLRRLSKLGAVIIFTKISNDRSADPFRLKVEADKLPGFKRSYITKNLEEAASVAFNIKSGSEAILVCGSLYLIGEFKKLYLNPAI